MEIFEERFKLVNFDLYSSHIISEVVTPGNREDLRFMARRGIKSHKREPGLDCPLLTY